jgi:hypothetical protein
MIVPGGFLRTRDCSFARPRLWPKPAAPHDSREHSDDNDQHSPDSTSQDHSNDHVRDDVSDAVRLRPEMTDDPAAQRQAHHEGHEECAKGPPVTQPAAAPPTDTGLLPGRERVGWHAP